ncbi:MAG: hypothetical protein SH857_16050 [Chitinophagales bacterium]|nr:hypothetical protein [Chitinophagales bacterium]
MPIKIFFLLFVFCLLFVFSCKEHQQSAQIESVALVSSEEKFFVSFLDSLKQTGANDYQVVNEIRKYLALKLDHGESLDSLALNYYKMPWKELSGFHCLELFEKNTLTAKCGLTSYVLAKLYDYAGYQNYIYNCGYVDHVTELGSAANIAGRETVRYLTHEFNLVELQGKLYVQDAFFNIAIHHPDDTPKDFFQLLTEIKEKNFSEIQIKNSPIVFEYWTDSISPVMYSLMQEIQSGSEPARIDTLDDRCRIKWKVSYDFLSGEMLIKMREKFRAEGFAENFLSAYLKPLHLKNGNTGEPVDSLLKKITAITNTGSQD